MTSSGQEQIAFDNVQTNGKVCPSIHIPKRVGLVTAFEMPSNVDRMRLQLSAPVSFPTYYNEYAAAIHSNDGRICSVHVDRHTSRRLITRESYCDGRCE